MANQFGYGPSGGADDADGVQNVVVHLIGTNWVYLPTKKRGIYSIMAQAMADGGPTLSFQFARALSTTTPPQVGMSFAATSADGNSLSAEWPSNTFIRIRKEMASYDGAYQVLIIGP